MAKLVGMAAPVLSRTRKRSALEARTAVGEARTELQLLTDDPRVPELADRIVNVTFTLHEAPDRADRDRRAGLTRAAHNTFVAAAGPPVRGLTSRAPRRRRDQEPFVKA